MRWLAVILVMTASIATDADADERSNAERIAKLLNGEVEVRQWDGTRVDILTANHAIEVDYARKWAEAVGQSLYYAQLTGKKPGICLLVKDASESRFVYRCQTVCAKHGIELRTYEAIDNE